MPPFATNKELVRRTAEACGIPQKDVRSILSSAIDYITDELMYGNDVKVLGLGLFKTAECRARKGRNLRTGATIDIAASRVVRFYVSRALARRIRGV